MTVARFFLVGGTDPPNARSTTMTIKGFSVGSTVAISADLVWLYGAAANVIAEIVDVRLAGGAYLYKLVNVASREILAEGVPAGDLCPVWC